MKKFLPVLLGLLLAVSSSAQTTPPQGIRDKTPQLKAYINARIYVDPERVIERGTILVDQGKILAVGAGVAIPDGAVRVDLDGMTVYPGFIDAYTDYGVPEVKKHKWSPHDPPVYSIDRIGCNAWNGAIHAERNCIEEFEPDPKAAEAYRRIGFTTVQSVVPDGIFRGRAFVTSLGEGLSNDLVIRPLSWQCLSFDKGSSKQDYPGSLIGAIALVRQTLYDANWYHQAWTAYEKNRNQPEPEVNVALAALDGLQSERIVVEVDDYPTLLRADRIGQEFNLDVIPVGGRYAFERLDDIKATGRTLILPLNFPDPPDVSSLESELDVTLGNLRRWDWAPSNPSLLEKAGVEFALTSHGIDDVKDFLKNLRTAVKRGLTPRTALAALTTVPAALCGVDRYVGTLEPGKLADFVVCDGDLFDRETDVRASVTRGQWDDLKPLDRVSFDGDFVGTINDRPVDLSISEKDTDWGPKITGSLKSGETKVDLMQAERLFDKLSFAAPLDSFGVEGIARFSLRRVGDQLDGKVMYPDHRLENWTAAAEPGDGDDDEDVEEEQAEDVEEVLDAPISRLTYPNIAFGFETLPDAENVLIKNGTVWTSENEGILENTDLLVKDGKIAAIGQDLEAPSGYAVIDASGKHVTAGIIDEHSHICIAGDVNEGSDAVTCETRIGDCIRDDDITVYRSLAGGVTATRTAHGSANPIGGQQQTIKLRWGRNSEEMKSDEAMPAVKFALGENVRQCNWGEQFRIRYPQTRMGVERIIRDVLTAAREYGEEWDAYRALSRKERERRVPPRRNLRLDAALQLLNEESFIDCHAYVQSEILMLMRLAEDFDIRVLNFIHILEGYKVADEMAKHGAMGGSIPDWWAYKFEVYDAIPEGPAIMAEHGVTVSITSDSHHLQRLLNQAAAKSVQYGAMSQEEAWKMVTINAAKQLKAEDELGSLKVGKDADFVIWDGNPLSVYSKVEQTWIDGVKYFDVDRDKQLRAELTEEKSRLIQAALRVSDQKKRKRRWGDHDASPYIPDLDEKGGSDE